MAILMVAVASRYLVLFCSRHDLFGKTLCYCFDFYQYLKVVYVAVHVKVTVHRNIASDLLAIDIEYVLAKSIEKSGKSHLLTMKNYTWEFLVENKTSYYMSVSSESAD